MVNIYYFRQVKKGGCQNNRVYVYFILPKHLKAYI